MIESVRMRPSADRSAFEREGPWRMGKFDGKRVIVTGAGAGIGRAIALAFANQGARVAVGDLNLESAQAVAGEIGSSADAFQVDVSLRASVEPAFAAVFARFGGCDILVSNAGVSTMARAVDLTDEDWDFNFRVNTRGIFLTNQIVARRLLADGGGGVIINTASLAAKVGAPLLAH